MSKRFIILIVSSFLFLGIISFVTANPDTLNTFSDGSFTKTVTLMPGEPNTEAKITLPVGATVTYGKVCLPSGVSSSASTPYIWVPLSGINQLVQIDTSTGNIIHTFSNGNDNCAANAFDNPSRITYSPPDGDVWVANRADGDVNNASVTRLGLNGAGGYECKDTYYDIGPAAGDNLGPRGVTFDSNSDVWVGDYGTDKICKYQPDGTLITCKNSGCRTYGMIGDSSGNVWIADRANGQVCKCSGDVNCSPVSASVNEVYGIGIDNEGDIWIGNYSSSGQAVYQISGSTGGNITPAGLPNVLICGVAVDGNDIVWAAAYDDDKIYAFHQDGTQLAFSPIDVSANCDGPRGVAIDADNDAWIVCLANGHVLEIDGSTGAIKKDIDVGDSPYNYSDMTGFRTANQTVCIGSKCATLSSGMTEIADFEGTPGLTEALKTESSCQSYGGTVSGSFLAGYNCTLPLTVIPSGFASGTLTLSFDDPVAAGNCHIEYTSPPPPTLPAGLVPCGRYTDDPSTSYDERDECTICHLFLMLDLVLDFVFWVLTVPVAILLLVIGGFFYIFSTGNEARLARAKSIIFWALAGLTLIFISWLTVAAILSIFGYIDPLGGQWDVIC